MKWNAQCGGGVFHLLRRGTLSRLGLSSSFRLTWTRWDWFRLIQALFAYLGSFELKVSVIILTALAWVTIFMENKGNKAAKLSHHNFFVFSYFFGFCFWQNKFLNIQPHVLKPVCSTCNKTVSHRSSVICVQCFKPIHLKYNNLNFVDCQLIKNSNSSWFCLHCSNNIFPFTDIKNKKL